MKKELLRENADLKWEKRNSLFYLSMLYIGTILATNDKTGPLWMPLVSKGLIVASVIKTYDHLKLKFNNDEIIKNNNSKILRLEKE